MSRALVVVLDACGVGALPDAPPRDRGANTLAHIARAVGGFELPALAALGLGNVTELAGVPPLAAPPAVHGRLHALGPGQDSTTGHWELMGVVPPAPMPVYPDGFPPGVVAALERATGHRVLGNAPANGLAIIDEFGPEQLEHGGLIVYTSQDSVLQIAAHVDRVPPEELLAACRAARAVMTGEHAVGRVIARPFTGEPGAFARTADRHDLALPPPGRSHLDELGADGVPLHAVGKVSELFGGAGIAHPAADNAEALAAIDALLGEVDEGLVFANLVDTDQVHAHRKDPQGFHAALREIDAAVARWRERLRPEDLLILTADHGCDITTAGTDHTREHVPLLALPGGPAGRGARHDGPMADVGATVLRRLTGRDAPAIPGTPFLA